MNFQSCHNQIFASLDFSFEGLYQAIRRCYRFGQRHEVNCYLITTDTMINVKQSIENKQKQFEHMLRAIGGRGDGKVNGYSRSPLRDAALLLVLYGTALGTISNDDGASVQATPAAKGQKLKLRPATRKTLD